MGFLSTRSFSRSPKRLPRSVPRSLGCEAWWTAEPGYYTTDTNVDSLTDKIGGYKLLQAVSGQQPVRNATGNFPSGRPTLTFTRTSSQSLAGTIDLSNKLDNNQPFTAAMSFRIISGGTNLGYFGWDSASTQVAGLWLSSTLQARHRYRDPSTLLQATPAAAGSTASNYWSVITYDGNDTIRCHPSWTTESTNTGASSITFSATTFTVGILSSIGYGDFEMLDLVVATRDMGASGSTDRTRLHNWLNYRMGV